MIITTTESIQGKEIKEVYGLVTASTVRSKNICKRQNKKNILYKWRRYKDYFKKRKRKCIYN